MTAYLKSMQFVYLFSKSLKANKYCNFTTVADSSEGNRYKKNVFFSVRQIITITSKTYMGSFETNSHYISRAYYNCPGSINT